MYLLPLLIACGATHRAYETWPPSPSELPAPIGPTAENPVLYQGLAPVMRTRELRSDVADQTLWLFYVPREYVVDLLGEDELAKCDDAIAEGYSGCTTYLRQGVMLRLYSGGWAVLHLNVSRQQHKVPKEAAWLIYDNDEVLPIRHIPLTVGSGPSAIPVIPTLTPSPTGQPRAHPR